MYKIYDNLTDIEKTKEFFREVTTNNFPWFIGRAVTVNDAMSVCNIFIDDTRFDINQKCFVHMAFAGGAPNSGIHDRVKSYIDDFCQKAGIEYESIMRAQFNLVQQHPNNRPSLPHVDNEFVEHGVILFYLNDSDGDTIFYSKDGEVEKTVSPKEGRVIAFDGTHVHSGGAPRETDLRIVLNVNLKGMKWSGNEEHAA